MTEKRLWRGGLILLSLFAGFSYLWRIASGARSEYYAAIAVSMSKNFSNFFYGAFDPAGTVSLDKIPGSYWLPALFAKLFGFSTWSIEAPNALAAIATVVIVAMAVRRALGVQAGLIAGLILVTTPVITAVARSNQPQMFFILALAIVADRALVALKTGSQRSLIWTGIWIGVAFQTYMLEAWAVWPALIIAWLATSDLPWFKRLKSLFFAGAASLVVSLSWITCVWLTPAGSRPYVGGTNHNNPWEMVFGYNGLGRFSFTQSQDATTGLSSSTMYRSFTPPFSGPAGLFRLFNSQVGGQISWLLLTTFLAISILIFLLIKMHNVRPFTGVIIFFSLWFLTFYLMFSTVAGMHQFYTSSMAIPIAVLIALTFTTLANQVQIIEKVLISSMVVITLAWSWKLSNEYVHFFNWSYLVATGLGALALITIFWRSTSRSKLISHIGIGVAALSLTLTPAVWALDNVRHSNSINPTAGPSADNGNTFGGFAGFGSQSLGTPPQPPVGKASANFNPPNFHDPLTRPGNGGPNQSADKSLIQYLEQNRLGSKFLLATFGGMSAAPYITATGQDVLPIGGFDGADPTPSLTTFKSLVQSADVKFVLTSSANNQGSSPTTAEIENWVTTNCTLDSQAPDTSNLYRCSPEVANN